MNITNDKQAKKSMDLANRKQEQRLDDLRDIVGTRSGRRFMWDLLDFCQPFANAMTGNSQTFFNLGMQKVGQRLFNDLMEAAPEAFQTMRKEALAEAIQDQQIIENAE